MISRRRFLQAGAATGVVLAMPRWAYPFSQSVAPIKKYVVDLPGLIADTDKTTRGIPVLTPDTVRIKGVLTDVYTIAAVDFTQDLLGAAWTPHQQRLWGYASVANDNRKYLGGVIIAKRVPSAAHPNETGNPVRLIVKNELPGPRQHILPVDPTLIDPVVRAETGDRQDRITVHLHGGFVFWHVDGGPFTWFSNPTNFVHGSSFINGPTTGPDVGTATYDYPNDQSARTIWYHDHAYSLTRINVFAGLATAYLITDEEENGPTGLIARKVLPGAVFFNQTTERLGIPLILQDKTFWDGPNGNDPTYSASVPTGATTGDLWYPHIYEGALDTDLPDMGLPPDLAISPVPKARWGTTDPAASSAQRPSTVPEYFSDTILVNGAPFPKFTVQPRRYRFRLLNASNARFYNLGLFEADFTVNDDGIELTQFNGEFDVNGNPLLAPDPTINPPGPAFLQVANEAGFLPAPAFFSTAADGTANFNSNRPMGFTVSEARQKKHPRADWGREVPWQGDHLYMRALPGDPTLGNATRWNLVLAPAERADVIVDFRGFQGKSLILYNDAPAPFPGGDTRNDYYGNNTDLRSIGGAAPTMPGEGPDTRVCMRFDVATGDDSTDEPTFLQTVAMLKTELPIVFAATQPPTNISATRTITKTLGEDNDEIGRLRQFLGNASGAPRTYLDFPSDVATNGEVQEWQIYNLTADTHPMHFHLVNVHVKSRQVWDFNPDGTPKLPLTPIGPDLGVDPNEGGWKETVRMNPGTVTTVVMQFVLPTPTAEDPAPPPSPRLLASYGIKGAEYVWHCHILEHEEHDMMRPIVVV